MGWCEDCSDSEQVDAILGILKRARVWGQVYRGWDKLNPGHRL